MSHYLGFLALLSVVTLAPGPDTFLTLRNTAVAGMATLMGRRTGSVGTVKLGFAGALAVKG